MELFFNIYKKQLLSFVLIFVVFTLVLFLTNTEARLFSLIVLAAVSLITAIVTTSKHLTTPKAFRRCDFIFMIGIAGIVISILCIIQIVQTING